MQTDLLAAGSRMDGSQQDSVEIILNVFPNNYFGQLSIQALQTTTSPFGTFQLQSNDPSVGNGLWNRAATIFTIPVIDIFIPSGFSPNRDGFNDKFVITHPFNTNISLEVFNRWGNLVFRSAMYQNEWDGKGNQPNNIIGEDLTDGTYYYIVVANDKTNGAVRKFSGVITLKR